MGARSRRGGVSAIGHPTRRGRAARRGKTGDSLAGRVRRSVIEAMLGNREICVLLNPPRRECRNDRAAALAAGRCSPEKQR
jgi:hypothetical protein